MAIATRRAKSLKSVIFDLDRVLLDRAPAWRYSVEEAVVSVTGRRVSAAPLAGEYATRPWEHALRVLVEDPREAARCAELCQQMFYRSALKRLLVYEGIGMALDGLRGDRIEMGAISRERHQQALLQVQSAGLDRFIGALSATPAGEAWSVAERAGDCLRFFECEAESCAFVSDDDYDLGEAEAIGLRTYGAGWTGRLGTWERQLARPDGLALLAEE